MNKNKELLPWHINQTLSEKESQSVDTWLQGDPDADIYQHSLKQIARVINSQETLSPSLKVRARIHSDIQQPLRGQINTGQWIWGVPLVVLFFALLWLIIQPGNQLQWSVNGTDIATFRVYRAPLGESTFELVEELPALPSQEIYHFADPLILPGQNYHYAIETIDQSGNRTINRVAINNSLMAATAQFAILLTSLMLTFGMITIAKEFNQNPQSYFVGKTF